VHATIAGVLLAFTIPVNTFIDRKQFLESSRGLLDCVETSGAGSPEEHIAVHGLEMQCELVQSPWKANWDIQFCLDCCQGAPRSGAGQYFLASDLRG
jgi:hypothetical protein